MRLTHSCPQRLQVRTGNVMLSAIGFFLSFGYEPLVLAHQRLAYLHHHDSGTFYQVKSHFAP